MTPLLQIQDPGREPLQQERLCAIGIDLGTTHSLAAIAQHLDADGKAKVEILAPKGESPLIPSIVAFDEKSGEAVVGAKAGDILLQEPHRALSSVKRLMGRGIEDVRSLGGKFPFRIAADGKSGMIKLDIAGEKKTPVEISACILRAVRRRAEKVLSRSVDQAVITVPAYFDDAARSATRDAARLAGIEVLRLVNEPTAAALAYGLDSGSTGVYVVYDLGGGTFDVSLLRLEKGIFRVLATGGDDALGGDDFDHVLADHWLSQRKDAKGLKSQDIHPILACARKAREALSKNIEKEWKISLGKVVTNHRITRADFDALIGEMVERTMTICARVIEDAGIDKGEIRGVVLAGGTTRTPLVRQRVAEFFGKEPLSGIDPDTTVAAGAALQARALSVGSDNLLLDVTPLSLGLETMGGLSERIIDRNTPIPVSKAQEFTTFQNGQTALSIHVVQGERETVAENRSLARFSLSGITPMVAGAARVQVTFTLDADGLLTVEARDQHSGQVQKVEVRPSYGLTEDEMSAMLRDTLTHGRQDMDRRLLIESRVDAQRLIHAVSSSLQATPDLCPEDERKRIETCLAGLENAVKENQRAKIEDGVHALDEATQAFAERRMNESMGKALRGRSIDDFGNDRSS